ncbi:MAG: C-GCAxxG-C-C family protein [Bacteroidales bacterium]
MRKVEKAISFYDNRYNCAQSVLAAFAEDYQLPEDLCLRIACAFGAGMGRRQLLCGAVTGALMVLGLKFGKGSNDDEAKKKETYKRTVEFFEKFKQRHGSILCRELLEGLDLNNPDEYRIIEQQNMFQTHCRVYVQSAVTMLEDEFLNKNLQY